MAQFPLLSSNDKETSRAVWIVSILDIIIYGEGNALCMRDIGIPLAAAVHPYPMHLATPRDS